MKALAATSGDPAVRRACPARGRADLRSAPLQGGARYRPHAIPTGEDERAGATEFGYNQRLARVVRAEIGCNGIATVLIGEAGTPLH